MIRNRRSSPSRPRPLTRVLLALAPLLGSCQSFGNLNVFSLQQDVTMGAQSYEEFLAGAQVVSSGPQHALVQEVTGRLTRVAEERHPKVQGVFDWRAELVEDPQVNAFCLPGGYMVVLTGILPVTQDADGLAVVMGHEIAHATLRHGTEKVTRAMGFEAVSILFQQYVRDVDPQLVQSGLDVLVQLPYSRDAELEADREGLMTMAAAGYDPRESVAFWERMAANGQGAPPELLSTHPSDQRRIDQMKALLPEAMEIYRRATGAAAPPAP